MYFDKENIDDDKDNKDRNISQCSDTVQGRKAAPNPAL